VRENKGKRERPRDTDSLNSLLRSADKETLEKLARDLAASDISLRRRCLDFLRGSVKMSEEEAATAEAASASALWDEIETDLADLDAYGGGDEETTDRVSGLLYALADKLKKGKIPRPHRRMILEDVLAYIKSGNAGMDDDLYEVAYASCRDDEDRRYLAERLEKIGQEWPLDNARRIYRALKDREKFLELRLRKMVYGGDYHDLASFYWEQGEREKALEVGRAGLAKAEGRMTELRLFMADRAKKKGDRAEYLELHFQEATEYLTANSYQAFRELCTAEEWKSYEPQALKAMPRTRTVEQVKIRLLRKERDEAAEILSRERICRYMSRELLDAARRLEKSHPEKVLEFYRSGIGSLSRPMPRKEYSQIARVLELIRRVMLETLKDAARWRDFKREVQRKTAGWPAFQEEAAERLPDWREGGEG